MCRFVAVWIVLALLGGGIGGVAVQAQEATPIAGRDVPDPDAFDPDASPTPEPTPFPPLADAPADADAVAGVSATAREVVACINADDVLRLYALFSFVETDERWIVEDLPQTFYVEADDIAIAEDVPIDDILPTPALSTPEP